MRLVRMTGEQDEAAGRELRPVVLFNPRMSSGDVGLGLNARRWDEIIFLMAAWAVFYTQDKHQIFA